MFLNLVEKIYAAKPSIDDIYDATHFDSNANTNLDVLAARIIDWILWIGVVLIFIYLLISGIMIITANGNAEQAKKGQQGIIYGAIGAIVIALSLVLVRVFSYIGNNGAPIK